MLIVVNMRVIVFKFKIVWIFILIFYLDYFRKILGFLFNFNKVLVVLCILNFVVNCVFKVL